MSKPTKSPEDRTPARRAGGRAASSGAASQGRPKPAAQAAKSATQASARPSTATSTRRAPAKARATVAAGDAAAAQLWQAFDEAVACLQPAAAQPLPWCSPAWAAQLGLSVAAAQALSMAELCQRLDGLAAGLTAVAEGADRPGTGWDGAVQLHRSAGDAAAAQANAAQWLLASLRPLPGGALALRLQPESAHEMATRRHLEDRERLLFTSRSVAVGEMATTLAHELNQPLGAVTNVLRGLKARLAAAIANPAPNALPPLEQGVQLALDQVQYAARIIGRIRDYTQSRQPRRERVDVHALLHNSLTLLDWDLGRHGVQLRIDLTAAEDGAAAVAGDGVMLQQVMVNLLRNAIDAMSDTPAGERRLHIASRVDEGAGQIEIAIADTGCGMGEGGASQLFMPFYSTKPTGMGIGLNICRSLIELHQGRLWFTPNEGRGCTFHVALPLARGDEAGQLPHFLDTEATVS